MEELCSICGEVLKEDDGHAIIKISQERAVQNIRECTELRGLEWSCLVNKGDCFHVDCRKKFTKKDRIKNLCKFCKTASLRHAMTQTQAHRYPQLKNLTIALIACFVLKLCVSC